jgi:hypothetical protein
VPLLLLATGWLLLCRRVGVGAATRCTASRCGGGDKGSRRRDLGLVSQTQLFQDELIERRVEGHAGCCGDEVAGGAVARVDAAKKVEKEGAFVDGLADIAEGIDSLLHRLAVVLNRLVALSHGVEGMTQEDGARGFVHLEVSGDGGPKLEHCLVGRHGEVKDGVGDGSI